MDSGERELRDKGFLADVPFHAARRWAALMVAAIRLREDPRTLAQWASSVRPVGINTSGALSCGRGKAA